MSENNLNDLFNIIVINSAFKNLMICDAKCNKYLHLYGCKIAKIPAKRLLML